MKSFFELVKGSSILFYLHSNIFNHLAKKNQVSVRGPQSVEGGKRKASEARLRPSTGLIARAKAPEGKHRRKYD